MNYFSLNHKSPNVSFEEAALKGQAPDKGLYFPEQIPLLRKDFISNIKNYSKEEIGMEVMKPYVAESIDNTTLQQIIAETVGFNFPLLKVSKNIFSLELFHGPTLAFKDVGAKFMSGCLSYFNRNKNHHTTVLVATSGDTGGAAANGFLNAEGVNVIILYPSKKVSPIQELQLTTLGSNITAIEVEGDFDACQFIVKKAFTDIDLNKKYSLTSANSINIARWLPQQLHYFFALQQWNENKLPVISVPSGNFGNICAGLLAYKSGLPVKHFIAACNENDVVTNYLNKGDYVPKPAIATVSNAMDVGNPSNFIRIMQLFDEQLSVLKKVLISYSVSDAETKATIKEVFQQYDYVLDPHGAVAYYALKDFLDKGNEKGVFLETAHPVKFPNVVEEATNTKIKIPDSVKYLLSKQKKSILMKPDFDLFKEWMMTT